MITTQQLIQNINLFKAQKIRIVEIDETRTFKQGNVKSFKIVKLEDVDNILNTPEGRN
jgi:hypothetical protein